MALIQRKQQVEMLAAFGSSTPERFDFRTVDSPENRRAGDGTPLLSNHAIWDWTFRADPARAPEFLDIRDASSSGATFTGSGLTTVTTAEYFSPGQTVFACGSREQLLVADYQGRITFQVHLGPPHQSQQDTFQALLDAMSIGYWRTRAVIFYLHGC